MIVTVTQEHRKAEGEGEELGEKPEELAVLKQQNFGTRCEFAFKGFGISLIDNKPQELLYICLNELDLEYTYQSRELIGCAEDNEEIVRFMMDIGNLQIDNLVNNEMPVIFGAKDFFDRNVVVDREQDS